MNVSAYSADFRTPDLPGTPSWCSKPLPSSNDVLLAINTSSTPSLFVDSELSRVALIPDEEFLSHAPWCYYGIYYGIFSVDSVPFADYLLTSAGVLRLMVTEWSLYVCGRRRMATDGVWRA